MEFILLSLAVILAIFLGWLLKATFNAQPWVAEPTSDAAHQAPMNANAKTVALSVLLAVITSFFALILSAYTERMKLGDWIPLTEPQLLWLNTGMLVAASLVFQWTRNAALKGQLAKLMPGMLVTGVLTMLFVAGQLIAWRELHAGGEYLSSNPSVAFFFLLTGVHAIHILGGMYVWARAMQRLVTDRSVASVRQSIELCAVYWHYLLLVWLVLFGLLLST
ncbi:MAG TPA: cytochrome c oxidase subunit 3 [Woeseiaceae bacterium]|nr:cytochrome c oxidase subunit 3 [Woeseiaceae bacterium]